MKIFISLLCWCLLLSCCLTETPLQSDTIINTWCVATHYNEGNYNDPRAIESIVNLGIRTYRQEFDPKVWQTMSEHGRAGIALMRVSPTTTTASLQAEVNSVSSVIAQGAKVDSIEGPNEPNGFWPLLGWKYNGQGYPDGVRPYVTDLWKMTRQDSRLSSLPVIGPAWSQASQQPFPKGTFNTTCTWGNFHPYPTENCFQPPFVYDNMTNYFCHGSDPINTIGKNYANDPYVWYQYVPAFEPLPMAITETGYSTTRGRINERVHGKYIPRILLEGVREDYKRVCIYELLDQGTSPTDPEANYGLVHLDFSPKPAYTSLKNLIQILSDPGNSFSPTPLDLKIVVNPPPGWFKVEWVHHLLLQKRNGEYLIVLWHEINLMDVSVTPFRELTPPDMPVTITVGTPMKSGIIHSWSAEDGTVTQAPATLENGGRTFTTAAQDRVRVIQLTPQK